MTRLTEKQAKKMGIKDDRKPFVGHFYGTLSWPPSVNHLYVTKRNGRRYLSDKGKLYLSEVSRMVVARKGKYFGKADLHLTIKAYPPSLNRVRDLDNLLKIVQDGLGKGGLYADDSQISKLTIERMKPDDPGYIEVFIKNAHLKGI